MASFKTTYPEEPIKDFSEWREYLANHVNTPEAKFEANFMRIWTNYKQDIINARTKKK